MSACALYSSAPPQTGRTAGTQQHHSHRQQTTATTVQTHSHTPWQAGPQPDRLRIMHTSDRTAGHTIIHSSSGVLDGVQDMDSCTTTTDTAQQTDQQTKQKEQADDGLLFCAQSLAGAAAASIRIASLVMASRCRLDGTAQSE